VKNKILASVGGKKNTLVVQLEEYKGVRTIDIRKYFYSNTAKDFIPTKKGITFTKKTYQVMKNLLDKHHSEIISWLDESGRVTEEVSFNQKNKERALLNERFSHKPIEQSVEEWKSPCFFESKAHGGIDKLVYNKSHSFFSMLEDLLQQAKALSDEDKSERNEKIDDLKRLIDVLLVTYVRAQGLFDDAPVIHPGILFETLEFNWGTYLNNALSNEE